MNQLARTAVIVIVLSLLTIVFTAFNFPETWAKFILCGSIITFVLGCIGLIRGLKQA